MMATRNAPINPKKRKLNELGQQWNPTEQQDAAAQQSLWMEIWQLIFDIYDPDLQTDEDYDAFLKVIDEVQRLFRPEKGSLSAFVSTRMQMRKLDLARKKKLVEVSYDDEESGLSMEVLGGVDRAFREVVEQADVENVLYELSAQILHFAEHHNKKTGSKARRNYYQLFYTSDLTSYIKEKGSPPVFQHPRDLMTAMKFAFVDFCLAEAACRTIPAIWKSDLKPYQAVVTATKRQVKEELDGLIPLPIPDKVGISYLEREEQYPVTKGAYSQMRSKYSEEMSEAILARGFV